MVFGCSDGAVDRPQGPDSRSAARPRPYSQYPHCAGTICCREVRIPSQDTWIGIHHAGKGSVEAAFCIEAASPILRASKRCDQLIWTGFRAKSGSLSALSAGVRFSSFPVYEKIEPFGDTKSNVACKKICADT